LIREFRNSGDIILISLVINRLPIDRLARERREESDNLPDLDVLAQEIADDLEAAPGQVRFSIHAPSL